MGGCGRLTACNHGGTSGGTQVWGFPGETYDPWRPYREDLAHLGVPNFLSIIFVHHWCHPQFALRHLIICKSMGGIWRATAMAKLAEFSCQIHLELWVTQAGGIVGKYGEISPPICWHHCWQSSNAGPSQNGWFKCTPSFRLTRSHSGNGFASTRSASILTAS